MTKRSNEVQLVSFKGSKAAPAGLDDGGNNYWVVIGEAGSTACQER